MLDEKVCVRSTSSLSRSYTCNPFFTIPSVRLPLTYHVLWRYFLRALWPCAKLHGLCKPNDPLRRLSMPVTAAVQGRDLLLGQQCVAVDHPRRLRGRASGRLSRRVLAWHHRDVLGPSVSQNHLDAQRAGQPLHPLACVLS